MHRCTLTSGIKEIDIAARLPIGEAAGIDGREVGSPTMGDRISVSVVRSDFVDAWRRAKMLLDINNEKQNFSGFYFFFDSPLLRGGAYTLAGSTIKKVHGRVSDTSMNRLVPGRQSVSGKCGY